MGVSRSKLLNEVDSVRYATTLGTNALIERKGPKIGLLTTAGFKATVNIGRGRAYGEGLSPERQRDLPQADRPFPLVPPEMVRIVRERVDYAGTVLMELDEDDLRLQIRELIDAGAEAIVIAAVAALQPGLRPTAKRAKAKIVAKAKPDSAAALISNPRLALNHRRSRWRPVSSSSRPSAASAIGLAMARVSRSSQPSAAGPASAPASTYPTMRDNPNVRNKDSPATSPPTSRPSEAKATSSFLARRQLFMVSSMGRCSCPG